MSYPLIGLLVHSLIVIGVIVRVMIRPHRDPASRIAWVAVIGTVPVLGVLAYLLLGETSIGSRRKARMKRVIAGLPPLSVAAGDSQKNLEVEIPTHYQHLFATGKSISGGDVLGGNSGRLMQDSNSAIDAMVADIDAATDHVHLTFYIWLADHNGLKMVEALKRAARRGVHCRAMADDLGSRKLIRSQHWQDMKQAGVKVAEALPIGSLLAGFIARPFRGRLDLRNHRKVLVIDDRVTYCGSQNCADPEFLVKARYAPWVDAVIRFEGPVVRQNEFLFASDWMSYADDNIDELLKVPLDVPHRGFPAQVIGTGPTVRFSAMPEIFESLFHTARRELCITTPYYVPNSSMQSALCAAAWRGVKTTVIFPARNDSWIVAAASRSYYQELLEAGVEIHEYLPGLLHTKSLTLDGEITLIGSANMDRRSFDLNYENNILFYDAALTEVVQTRQHEYLAQSQPVTRSMVDAWPLSRRLWNNTLATLGPIL